MTPKPQAWWIRLEPRPPVTTTTTTLPPPPPAPRRCPPSTRRPPPTGHPLWLTLRPTAAAVVSRCPHRSCYPQVRHLLLTRDGRRPGSGVTGKIENNILRTPQNDGKNNSISRIITWPELRSSTPTHITSHHITSHHICRQQQQQQQQTRSGKEKRMTIAKWKMWEKRKIRYKWVGR